MQYQTNERLVLTV